jgi:hypothetical protein
MFINFMFQMTVAILQCKSKRCVFIKYLGDLLMLYIYKIRKWFGPISFLSRWGGVFFSIKDDDDCCTKPLHSR